MKRNTVVGILAAILGVLLISFFLFLELRYSENGAFMREWAVNGKPNLSFDDTMKFMTKWVHILEFVLSPLASFSVGLFVGFLCRSRYWLALLIGVAPVIVMNYPSDVLSIIAGFTCIFAAWIGAKSAHTTVRHFATSRQTAATT